MTTLQRIIDAIIMTALLTTLAFHSAHAQSASLEQVGASSARSSLGSSDVAASIGVR